MVFLIVRFFFISEGQFVYCCSAEMASWTGQNEGPVRPARTSSPLSLSVRLCGEQKAASESGRRTPEEKKAAALQRCGEWGLFTRVLCCLL